MAWIMAPSMPGRRRFYGMVWAVGVAAEPAGPHSFLCRVGLQLHMASGCVGRRLCLRVRTCSQCSIQVVERDEHAARLPCVPDADADVPPPKAPRPRVSLAPLYGTPWSTRLYAVARDGLLTPRPRNANPRS